MNNIQSAVVRNSRGLSIAGTRITLYDIMDYVTENWPPQLIQYWLNLTDQQIKDAMDHIENNRAEVEAEYRLILEQAEEIRQYWEERNREHFAKIRTIPRKSEKDALWAKLSAEKARLEQEYGSNSD